MRNSLAVLLLGCVSVSSGWWFGDPSVDPHEEVSEECLRYAAWGRCEFYDCLERRFPCGHTGYVIQVGRHFCQKVDTHYRDFTDEGRLWLNRTSVCLTSNLARVYRSYASRCGDIRNEGAESILECNSRTDPDGQDFCSFVQDNSDAYQDLFSFEDITRLARMRKPGVMTRLFVDAASCGADALQDRFHAFLGSFNELVGSFLDKWEGLVDRWNQLWD